MVLGLREANVEWWKTTLMLREMDLKSMEVDREPVETVAGSD